MTSTFSFNSIMILNLTLVLLAEVGVVDGIL